MKIEKPNAFAFDRGEVEKLAAIGAAARAIAKACQLNKVNVEDVLPLIVSMAKKELAK